MSHLDELVNITVTTTTATPSRAGFGTPLIAAYHTRWNDRVRVYTSLSAMAQDGFLTTDPAYKAASAMLSQNPRVTRVKIGRRGLAFTQRIVLTPNTPVDAAAAETYAVKLDGLTASFPSDATPTVGEVCTGLAAAINALGDADAIITSRASSGSDQTVTGAGLNGFIGVQVMDPPRPVTLTLSNHADWDATTAVVTGTNAAGATIFENLAIANGGNATVTGTKYFRTVTSVLIPAQSGTGGSFTLGVRQPFYASVVDDTVVCVSGINGGPVAGELHSVELVVPNGATLTNLALRDSTTDPGIATDLAAILLADSDWYGLVLDSNSEAEINAAAAWVEANRKVFVPQTADTATMDSGSTTDIAADLKAAGYARTALYFAPTIGLNWLAAGALAERLPFDPGSDTWAYKSPVGVSTYTLTDTQRTNLLAKRVNVFTVLGGLRLTEPGITSAGEWMDVTRFVDWLRARMQERLFGLLVSSQKVPYTDAGVDLIRAEVKAQIDAGIAVGGLASSPEPIVTAPKVADVSQGDRSARHLPDVTWSARLAGAIHTLDVSGTVSA